MNIPRTEQGDLLRQIADATDLAEAFIALEIDADQLILKAPVGAIPAQFQDMLNTSLRAHFEPIRAAVADSLTAQVGELQDRYAALSKPEPTPAPQPRSAPRHKSGRR